ncbi:TPM domain-containing protein [Pedosphaera parvula]|uniref:TPM domain-containing protein n=1 Tax=Pedosphaera parvula (strain Ellin514) TaxID=320771 RepID=B9XDI7_PEDPL|nr:TPM domain-containing protein [Pedosphaera parvula]EEF62133.1 protein of unknown function DUF477 [Pedosphaera parvula Ellin514]
MKQLCFILGLIWCFCLSAAEVIPPAPKLYFNDYAHVVSAGTAQRLNQQLEDFERQTSSQLLVAIYPKMETDSSIEDYTVRVFREWKPGLKDKNNGAVLFVFVQEHKMRIATGYGLEGAMPDAICKRIVQDEIAPHLKQNDWDGGMTAGVAAMMAAAKGEYKGTGGTVADQTGQNGSHSLGGIIFLVIVGFFILSFFFRGPRRRGYSGWTMGSGGFGGWGGGGWTSGGGGGSWGGGGGGGGGFSGGGGSTGGGGASGSW